MKKKQLEVYDQSFEVEKIIDDRIVDGVKEYRVKWLGYDKEDDCTWEPICNLKNCRDAIENYEREAKIKRKKLVASDFYSCQKYPFATIKIDPQDPLLPKFTSTPFSFRK